MNVNVIDMISPFGRFVMRNTPWIEMALAIVALVIILSLIFKNRK